MAPELLKSEPYNNSIDIWSLGCVFYELLTYNKAFIGQNILSLTLKILNGDYTPFTEDININFKIIISSMLSIDPKERPSIAMIFKIPLIKAAVEKLIYEHKTGKL